MKFTQAIDDYGTWILPHNDVWNVPTDTNEVRFDYTIVNPFHRTIGTIKGLAVTLDGKIFGMRTMYHPKQSGYQLEGRVSIGGKKYSAFTSSKIFRREDKSLFEIAVFIVRGIDKKE